METIHNRQYDVQAGTHQPAPIGAKLPMALLFGIGAVLGVGVVFGSLSLITMLLGVVGSVFAGVAIATALLTPFTRIDQALAIKMFPLSFVFSILSTLLIVLIPFLVALLRKDPDASLMTILNVAWSFYRLSLTHVGSSLIITVIGVLSGILGYLGRLNGLKKTGVYQA